MLYPTFLDVKEGLYLALLLTRSYTWMDMSRRTIPNTLENKLIQLLARQPAFGNKSVLSDATLFLLIQGLTQQLR